MTTISTEDLLLRTRAVMERLDTDSALASASRLLRTAPASDAAHFAFGVVAGRLGRRDAAVGALRNAARINRASPTIAYALGEALLRADDPESAIVAFRGSLDRGADMVDASVGLAACYAALGHLDAAERVLEPVLTREPEHPIATLYMGLIAESSQDWARAITWYRKASAASPEAVVAWVNLGRVLARNGQEEEASHALRRALTLCPDHGEARQELRALTDPC